MLNEENRKVFINRVAQQLGRPVRQTAEIMLPFNQLAKTRLTDRSQDELCNEFLEFASTSQKVNAVLSSAEDLIANLIKLCDEYGQSPIVASNDIRLWELGVIQELQTRYRTHIWDPALGSKNIEAAEQAKIGIVYAEAGLTESGGVALFSTPERGRSISLLPETTITILRKSSILPRVAQLAEQLHQMTAVGEKIPSCINLVGGPSSTADIELIKVFGVHGPVHAAYLVINDC